MQSADAINKQILKDPLTGVLRIPFYLEGSAGATFCWLHLPESLQIKTTGIVLCSPFGYEQVHSHQAYLHLADELAAKNNATIRFDFHGSSDSAGDGFSEAILPHYLKDIENIFQWMKANLETKHLSLIGLRTGASVAAKYSSESEVEKLVLWSPCVKGRHFVREMQALEKVAGHDKQTHDDFIDSGGFIYTNELLADLKSLDLLKQSYKVKDKCLLIERDDAPTNQRLHTHLEESLEQLDYYQMNEYLSMMAEPHESELPEECTHKIASLFSAEDEVHSVSLESFSSPTSCEISIGEESRKLKEEQFVFEVEDRAIFAVKTSPVTRRQDADTPLITLVNSGSVYHVGPNRIYVELARSLANQGFDVIRFDMSNLGDSVIGEQPEENRPYPSRAMDDIAEIILKLRKEHGYSNVVMSGLCSGAYHTLHSSLCHQEDPNWLESILINPLTFYRDNLGSDSKKTTYHVERYTHYYASSLKDITKWKKLFSGQSNLGHILSFAFQKLFKSIKKGFQEVGRFVGLVELSQLSQDLVTLADNDKQITFFLATKDPGYEIIMSAAKKTVEKLKKKDQLAIHFVKDADHTFSSFERRQEFIRLYGEHIAGRYSS